MDLAQQQQLFWQFSCELYDNKQLQEILHRLQDEDGVNINEILLLIWLTSQEKKLSSSNDWLQLKQQTSHITDWIQQIRSTRNQIKEQSNDCKLSTQKVKALRQSLLQSELSFEKAHQHLMLELVFNSKYPIRIENDNTGSIQARLHNHLKQLLPAVSNLKVDDLVSFSLRYLK